MNIMKNSLGMIQQIQWLVNKLILLLVNHYFVFVGNYNSKQILTKVRPKYNTIILIG